MSSSELQYITELGGQQLIPLPNADLDNHTSFPERLQLLRNKAQAWFKLDINRNSFGRFPVPTQYLDSDVVSGELVDGHLCLWYADKDSAAILPVLPKPSQQTIEHDWSPGSLCSVPNGDVFMDPAQNLIAVATFDNSDLRSSDEVRVVLGALDENGAHPQAAGRVLLQSAVLETGYDGFVSAGLKVKGLGRHIAVQRCRMFEHGSTDGGAKCMWWLQIWDWRHSTTSNVSLGKNS
ncbi:hypothetical protein AZE42_01739 [Rhizopogon vesiculosus]|uniref:Uncharacterized protein n=1 Tax=Rhizopogon vesiculosus TaxID=180088 RepID=A0A1J8PHZ7_9AGAM|nr:hypothetical protein AZE42_01739 [Rhizopogon vesiculosus]